MDRREPATENDDRELSLHPLQSIPVLPSLRRRQSSGDFAEMLQLGQTDRYKSSLDSFHFVMDDAWRTAYGHCSLSTFQLQRMDVYNNGLR
jgi:hypothetical protein